MANNNLEPELHTGAQRTGSVISNEDLDHDGFDDANLSRMRPDLNASNASERQPSRDETNFIKKLNQYCQKTKISVNYTFEKRCGPANKSRFFCKYTANGNVYEGEGESEHRAQLHAAQLVLAALHQQSDFNSGTDNSQSGGTRRSSTPTRSRSNKIVNKSTEKLRSNSLGWNKENSDYVSAENSMSSLSLSSTDNSRGEEYVRKLNQFCNKEKLSVNYSCGKRSCSTKNPSFFCKYTINGREYPEGEGDSKYKAKQSAAKLVLNSLLPQSSPESKSNNSSSTSYQQGGSISSSSTADESCTSDGQDWTASSQNTSSSKSDSIVFAEPSNQAGAQMPVTNTSERNDGHQELSQLIFERDFDSIVPLGDGGFGQVFKAREKLMKKYYAVKIVRGKKKALREVEVLSDLSHHNIVRYYNCWMDHSEYCGDGSSESNTSRSHSNSPQQYLYIKMELCSEETLKSWIEKRNQINKQDPERREDGLNLAVQIVTGVKYIHQNKLIHRDLKPPNILFGKDGKVKIGDFGLVTAEADDDDINLMERTKGIGTLTYMAPEQHENSYDGKVDIFALGLIYFELLQKIQTGHERIELFQKVKAQKFDTDFQFSFPEEYRIIKSMLHNKPKQRPDASYVATELKRLSETITAKKTKDKENVTV